MAMNTLCKTCLALNACNPEKKGWLTTLESWKAACGQGNRLMMVVEWFR